MRCACWRRAGFLVRQRRFKRVEGDGPGPHYEQTSNAYRPTIPTRLMTHPPRWMRPPPLPTDAIQRIADRAGEVAAMDTTLSCRELARERVGGALGRMLAKLGAAIDQKAARESHDDPQPLLKSIYSTAAASTKPADRAN